MKSKLLSVKNIPVESMIIKSIDVKPTLNLIVLIALGVVIWIIFPMTMMISFSLAILGTFCLMFFPNRRLMLVTQDFLVLYNQKNRNECVLVYWDEILFWRYVSQNDKDELEIELIEDRVERMECFSKKSIIPYLDHYAPGKEKKVKKGKR